MTRKTPPPPIPDFLSQQREEFDSVFGKEEPLDVSRIPEHIKASVDDFYERHGAAMRELAKED